MNRFRISAGWLVSALALVLGVHCGSDPPAPPPTVQELVQGCLEWAEVGCRKNMECVGIDGTLEECITAQRNKCFGDLHREPESCHRVGLNAIVGCASALKARSCADYCNTDGGFTFCSHPCVYACFY